MNVDFQQLKAAAHDDNTAKILRIKWKLDESSSASGSVVCDRADIERMLASGELEPVLSTEQFLSISHGKAYGTASRAHSPATASGAHAEPLGANDAQWSAHPDWAEFQSLSEPTKSAVQHDFPTFLFLKRRGALASLAETVGSQIERDVAARSHDHAKRAHEEAVAAAPVREAERFAATMQWARGKKNYPGLQK